MNKRIEFFKNNLKLGIHLVIGTKRFGVNNQLWSNFDSLFGVSWHSKINPYSIILRYKRMKFRATSTTTFLTKETVDMLWPNKMGM